MRKIRFLILLIPALGLWALAALVWGSLSPDARIMVILGAVGLGLGVPVVLFLRFIYSIVMRAVTGRGKAGNEKIIQL